MLASADGNGPGVPLACSTEGGKKNRLSACRDPSPADGPTKSNRAEAHLPFRGRFGVEIGTQVHLQVFNHLLLSLDMMQTGDLHLIDIGSCASFFHNQLLLTRKAQSFTSAHPGLRTYI